MNLAELKKEISQYQYFEDTNVIDIALASIIATRLQLGDPIWLIVIGASSGGKSQILRPLALTDTKFLHRVDDLTENTFLSGMKPGKGQPEISLLKRIGSKGMIVISDLTVIFSKAKESRATILSQFRMIYDGEMTKFTGTTGEPMTWKGYLGVLAGSTPSIYGHFEEVADMGERFIYYRMKDYSAEKATKLALERKTFGKDLDKKLSEAYEKYIKETIVNFETKEIALRQDFVNRIISISIFAEKIRTPLSMDFHKKEVIRKPVIAFPMRVALQLMTIAKGLSVMRELTDKDIDIIEWCGYSLANEEKRGVLRILARNPFDEPLSTQVTADILGLSTTVTGNILQNLSAVGVTQRTGGDKGLLWSICKRSDWELIRRLEGIEESERIKERELSGEEGDELKKVADDLFDNFDKK